MRSLTFSIVFPKEKQIKSMEKKRDHTALFIAARYTDWATGLQWKSSLTFWRNTGGATGDSSSIRGEENLSSMVSRHQKERIEIPVLYRDSLGIPI